MIDRPYPQIISSLGLVVATTGRKNIVEQTIRSIASRKCAPSCVVLVGACGEDIPVFPENMPFQLQSSVAPAKSLTIQRNHGMSLLPAHVQYVSFLDDDVEIHDHFFGEVEKVFQANMDVVGFHAHVFVNGNIDRTGARALLDQKTQNQAAPVFFQSPKRWPAFYGCSMNIRRRFLELEKFDENLPLYALGEDVEMGFRLSRHGIVGWAATPLLVHLAVRSGRINEVGLGYAQIINPMYFYQKKIGFPRRDAFYTTLIRLPLVNFLFLCLPFLDKKRASLDRRGRTIGNLLALRDAMLGRIDPKRLLKII